jgi:predicted protein tyrosine phosphatase
MQFIVVGRDEIERGFVVRTPYAVISITDPGSRRPRIREPNHFRGALFLKFHDAEDEMHPDIVLMKPAHAKRIWRFFREQQDKIGTLVVHCEQGASRSPAVAAAICKTLGDDDSRFFEEFMPNPYVYALLLKTVPRDFLQRIG